ncbi:MAG: hypothetical protein KF860_01860 [Cyclobacteriaceae bacterium]|nr:hypothetical protein [Cyclobacteriaceae bacterium]
MNSKLPYILAVCTVGCVALFSQEAVAQDGAYPPRNFQEPSYQELNLNEDKSLIYDVSESRPSRSTPKSIQRDSTSLNSMKPKANRKSSVEKKEEDPLSFNFLYYIIQKYKISDIVDQ